MAAKGKPGTPRRRRLSRPEVVAWIKDRQYQAVQLVWETLAAIARDTELAERKKPINWSLVHAIQDTRTPTWRIRGPNDSAAAAAAVARAEDELSAAEKDGRLLADANGLYSRVAVTKLFLALEGRGRKRQPRPYADRRKVEKLGQHMLRSPPGHPAPKAKKAKTPRRGPWLVERSALQKLEDWCLAHGIIPETRRHEFKSLRGKALAWAQEDLDARDRIRPNGLTDQELERQRANLEAWKELDAAWARQRSRDDTTGS